MNYLFVCSANKQRSKTAEDYLCGLNPDDEFQSAGTNHKICFKEGTTPLTEELLEWADKVYVMEHKHYSIIKKNSIANYFNKISVLDIPDHYKYGSKSFIKLLKRKLINSDLVVDE